VTKGSASVSLPASAAANGVNLFTAVYQGDANYTGATSNAVGVTTAQADFSLTVATPELSIAPGKSARAVLLFTPVNGFKGLVKLGTPAAGAASGVSAALGNASPAVTGPTTCPITLSVPGSLAPGLYPVTFTATAAGRVHTAQVLVAVRAADAGSHPPASTARPPR